MRCILLLDGFFEQIDPDFTNKFKEFLLSRGINLDVSILDEEESEELSNFSSEYIRQERKSIDKAYRTIKKTITDDSIEQIESIWGSSLRSSEIHKTMLIELIRLIIDIPNEKEDVKKVVLTKLFSKGIRTYEEIIVLLKNGLPFGAISITRNLFELMVITRFISESDEPVARAFFDASKDQIIKPDNYEWARASGSFGEKERISIHSIRERCNMENIEYKEIYTWHCKYTHPCPQSIQYEFGDRSLLADEIRFHTIAQLEIAGINSAFFINNILLSLFYFAGNNSLLLKCLLCMEWSNIIAENYKSIRDKIQKVVDNCE